MSFKDYFGFNKKERIGISTLLILLLLIIAGYIFLPELLPPSRKMSDEEFKVQVQAFIKARKAEEEKKREEMLKKEQENIPRRSIRQSKKLTPFKFNPNNLSADKWKKMGFSDKQIKIIHNYEESGGSFKKKTDLRRIYGIDEEEYAQLAPYINIPKQEIKASQKKSIAREEIPKEAKKPLIIELNSTDSIELIKVYGIGPAFSSRIVKFRDYLGGFYSKEQLLEVYGLDSSKYAQISDNFTVDIALLRTINLNTATFKELLAHPYMDYYLVKEIIKYRETNGPFESLEQLHNISLIYDELYNKITPYLIIK